MTVVDEAIDLADAVRQAQSGDRRAFATIYCHFADRLFRYLYVRCADIALAEDLAADLWVRVAESLPAFRFGTVPVEAAFSAWLYRIAHNLLVDNYRCRGRDNVPLLDTMVADGGPLDEQVLAREEEQELHRALAQLPDDQREVLMLRFFQEHSTIEIMRLMKRGESAVKSLQFRALGALARRLGEQRRRR